MDERPAGRPCELTAEIARKLSEAFKDGASIKVACALVGIDKDTYRRWKNRGRDGDPRFTAFYVLMEKSIAKPELQAYQAIRKAFLTSEKVEWKAAAKYIELKDPNRWRKKDPAVVPVADTEKLRDQIENEDR